MPRPSRPKQQAVPTTAPCVQAIHQEVGSWREAGHPGVSDTTALLLDYWFVTDPEEIRVYCPQHIPTGLRGLLWLGGDQ